MRISSTAALWSGLLLASSGSAAVVDVAWRTISESEAELYVIGEGSEVIIAAELFDAPASGSTTGLRSSEGEILSSSDMVMGAMPAFSLVPPTFTPNGSGTLLEVTWGVLTGGMPTGPVTIDSGATTGLRVLRLDFDAYARLGENSAIAVGWAESGASEVQTAVFGIDPLFLPRLGLEEISGTPDDSLLEFDDTLVGDSSSAQVVRCRNNGHSELVITSWEVDVTSPPGSDAVFDVTPVNPPESAGDVVLQPGASIDLEVVFAPTSDELYEGDLRFESTDPGGGISVSLQGAGIAQNLPPTICGPIEFTPDDAVPYGDPVTISVEVSDPDGSVEGVTFYADGSSLGDGVRVGTGACDRWSLVAASETFGGLGEFSITAVASDDEGLDTKSAPATLTVLGADLALLDVGDRFCSWTVLDGASFTEDLGFRNDGNAALTIDSIDIIGDGFQLTAPTQTMLAPGEATSVTLTYDPVVFGTFEADIAVASNDVFDPALSIPVEVSVVDRKVGDTVGDRLGWSVAGAGDIDGDGHKDFAAGAPEWNGGVGRVQVYSGRTGGMLFSIEGEAVGDLFGFSVVGGGDMDGDGWTDLIIGAPFNDGTGAVYVFRGFNPGGAPMSISAASLERIPGDLIGDRFGHAVHGARDLDGDGHRDFLVGAPIADTGSGLKTGRVYIHSSHDFARLARFDGESAGDQFGFAIDYLGDVNGDGDRDIAIGAFAHGDFKGRAYVYFMPDVLTGTPQVYTAADAVLLDGDFEDDRFGRAIASAGDVDGDGFDDLLVGAPSNDDVSSGRVELFYGSEMFDLAPASSVYTGESLSDAFGFAISTAGDVDGDGLDEIMVGAPKFDADGNDRGRIYIFDAENPEPRCVWDGESRRDFFGAALDRGGDMDGDGVDELLIGAWRADPGAGRGGPEGTGAAYVFYPGGGVIPQCPETIDVRQTLAAFDAESDAFFGTSVSMTDDWLVVGADEDDEGGLNAGAAYVYERDASTGVWSFHAKLVSPMPQPNAKFGGAVSVSGSTIAVGAFSEDDPVSNIGAVYVFDFDDALSSWTFSDRLAIDSLNADAQFGRSVSLRGDRLVVGAILADLVSPASGAAYVFARSGPTSWIPYDGGLLPINAQQAGDRVGVSVGQTASQILVGARLGASSPNTGAVHAFELVAGEWTQFQTVVPPDGAGGDRFGESLSVIDSTLIVGSPRHDGLGSDRGAAYIYAWDGSAWVFERKLEPLELDDGHQFGSAVAVSSDFALVGSFGDGEGGSETGAAYLFQRDGGLWTQASRIRPDDLSASGRYGWAVAFSNGHAAIGSPDADDTRGRVDVFAGLSDCDADGVLDLCQFDLDPASDSDGDGVIDECEPPVCPGDANGDLAVNSDDLTLLLEYWGDTVTPGTDGDVNGSGVVDFDDLQLLLDQWGAICSARDARV